MKIISSNHDLHISHHHHHQRNKSLYQLKKRNKIVKREGKNSTLYCICQMSILWWKYLLVTLTYLKSHVMMISLVVVVVNFSSRSEGGPYFIIIKELETIKVRYMAIYNLILSMCLYISISYSLLLLLS